MKFTDEKAKKIFKRIMCDEVSESIETFPEEEREGRTDLQIINEEVDYFLYMFEEEGTVFSEDLENAKAVMKETQNGKIIPLRLYDFKPKYARWEVEACKRTIAEYRQLKRISKRVKELMQ